MTMMMNVFPNGWAPYLTGGLLAGCGVALIFLTTGLRAGASSVFTTTWSWCSSREYFQREEFVSARVWRVVFSLGLVLGAVLFVRFGPGPSEGWVTAVPPWRLFVGGLLVGYGTRLSRGCTSGHGICGLAAGSKPSLAAVAVFIGVAMAVAQGLRSLGLTP